MAKATEPKAAAKPAAKTTAPAAKTAKAPKKAAVQAAGQSEGADENERGRMTEVTGEVVSDKMDKTISVLIFRLIRHKKYGKYMRRSSVFKAHDEKNVAKVGDTVRIYQTRPLSKTKRWALAEVVKAATVTEGVEV
ncbi:30S ribosomal protein S17 [bacterium]|nr:MAG: 30S ribosomal protein S17 [bacterium]